MDEPQKNLLPAAMYVNFLRVGYQQSEFFLELGQIGRDRKAAHLLSSLVTTPAHAKAMLEALGQAVERFEKQFGEVQLPEAPTPDAAMGASSPNPARPTAPPSRRQTG